MISVVVPTYNRAERLPRLLDALAAQRTDTAFEVIVVDDASTDATPEVLAALAATARVPVRALRAERNRGPAAARNLGLDAARGEWIAFTDDDCTPDAGWLAALERRFAHADIVQGRTVMAPAQPGERWFSWAPEVTDERGFYETCNIAYRRAVIDAQGGFDTGFRTPRGGRRRRRYRPPPWGEDTDLALRAKRAGASTAFADDAVVVHDRRAGGMLERLGDSPRRAGLVTIIARYPEMRSRLHDPPWFNERAHRWVVLGAVGAVVVLRRPRHTTSWLVAAALTVPWARERSLHVPRHLWLRVLPRQLLADVADVAVLAVASARERTLVL